MILEKYCILGSSTLTEVHIDISFKSTLIDKQKPWAHCFTFTSTFSSNLLSQTVWLKKKKKTWQMHCLIVLWIITACRWRRRRRKSPLWWQQIRNIMKKTWTPQQISKYLQFPTILWLFGPFYVIGWMSRSCQSITHIC